MKDLGIFRNLHVVCALTNSLMQIKHQALSCPTHKEAKDMVLAFKILKAIQKVSESLRYLIILTFPNQHTLYFSTIFTFSILLMHHTSSYCQDFVHAVPTAWNIFLSTSPHHLQFSWTIIPQP